MFLLCTDGLVEGIHDHHLEELLRAEESSSANVARVLVETAVRNDGRDNTTAVVIHAG
jgi:PPM family protein phosphatase